MPAAAIATRTIGCIHGRKVDQARASQPHFVSPMVTTHVMLVQQFRYDMSWQQDPAGGTVTSNYGASHGLEIISTTRAWKWGYFRQVTLCISRTSRMDLETSRGK
jgi:hypothetical protein